MGSEHDSTVSKQQYSNLISINFAGFQRGCGKGMRQERNTLRRVDVNVGL